MGSSRISFTILSAFITLAVLSTPAYSDKCSLACHGSPSSPTFLDGHTYSYAVDSAVSIYVTGAEKQETGVKIFGQVSVTALGNCALALKVNSMTISGPDGKKYPCPPGIDKVVQFSLKDGRLGPEICAENGDNTRSLNIKRAIISMLQTEQKPSTQIDVFGSCFTEVTSSQAGGATLVHRSRDLSRCAHREQGRSDYFTAVYNTTDEIKDTQVLQSTLNVESKLDNGVPEKVSATEQYLYKPFSFKENGARAEVNTKLTMTGKTQSSSDAGNCPERRTIIFENPQDVIPEQSNFESALNVLKDTSKALQTEASTKSAGKFAQLVRVLRTTSKDDLMKLFNEVKGNSLDKRVFLDALLRTGTGFSIEASIQILKARELSGLEEKLVYLSLGNARHVNEDAMKAAATILDMPDIPKEVYLGIGALTGAYCKVHNCHRSDLEGVDVLSKKLSDKLQNCKPKNKVGEDYVLAALKGIRNIGYLENNLIDKLVHCAEDDSVKARIRVAALEAFLANPCSAKIKIAALDLMKNRQLDSEIRIKAYLAVIECPCGKSASEIKILLDSEPVHQVGRFITTSLRHIRSSSNPDKEAARLHYGQIGLPNRFNIDDRKYSFYREAAFNIDALDAGGNFEQTVIYSQESFLPRSASLNLTAEIFGHSLNILEVGGRQGNLDRVVEHFFGMNGLFRTKKPQDIYDSIVERLQKSKEKVENNFVRRRRSIKTEVDNFDKEIKAESGWNNELDLDVYLKLFGTNAVFLSLGDDKGFNFDNFLDQMIGLLQDGMNKVKNFQNEIHGHLLFLDAELAYPTSTGLTLKLDLVGAATARVDVASNIDIRECFRNPENAKVDIKLIPSVDIEISGVMMVDAFAVGTGLKVVTNMHSSTGGHVIAKVIENGRGIDIQLGLPVEKQEILVASNELVYFTAEKGQIEKITPVKVDSKMSGYKSCIGELSDVIGLTICGEISVPSFAFGPKTHYSISDFFRHVHTGPATVKLIVEKNNLRGYHIKSLLRWDPKVGRYGAELLFEAEGCKTGKFEFNGDVVITNEEYSIRLALDSPFKVLSGEVALYTERQYTLLFKAEMDASKYYGKLGYEGHEEGSKEIYKPILEYSLPNNQKQVAKIDGQITLDKIKHEITWNLRNIKTFFPEQPLDLNGHFKYMPDGFDLDVKGKVDQHTTLLALNLKNADIKVEFQNTFNPYINFKMNGHFENNKGVAHNDIDLWYGEDLSSSQNRVTLNQFYKHHEDSKDFSIITKNKFEIHCLPIKLKAEVQVDHKKVDIDLEGQYFDIKGELGIEARTHIKKPGDYNVKLKMELDRQGIEAFAERDIITSDKSRFDNYIVVKGVGKYELSGIAMHKNKANDVNIGATGHLRVSGGEKNEDIKFDIGYIENTNLYSSHAKLLSSKGEILDFLLKVDRGVNANGQLIFVFKDVIAANGQFKVIDDDGKGVGMVIVDFKSSQRKIKGDIKFVVKEPVYNADIDLFLNYEKDNNDRLHISTNNKKTKKMVDSKNKLEYAGKKTEINVYQDVDVMGEGKSSAYVEVVLPSERCLTFKLDREHHEKDNVINDDLILVISDSEKRGTVGSMISYKGKLANAYSDKDTLHYKGQIDLRLKNGKQLTNSFTFKNVPIDNGKFKGDVKIDINGNLISKPVSLTATATYNNNEILDDNYRLKANYGDDMGLEMVGHMEFKTEGGFQKYIDDSTLSLRLPFEKTHDIKWVSNIQFLVPESNDFAEFTIMQSVQVNADVYKIDTNGKLGIENGNAEIKLLVPQYDQFVMQSNYKVSRRKEVKVVKANIQAHYGKFKRDLKLEINNPPREFEILLVANAPDAEKLKKLEIMINTKNSAPNTYSNVLMIQADDLVYKTEGVVVYSKSQPLFDLKYSSPSSTKPTRFYFKGETLSTSVGKLEMKLENVQDLNFDASFEGNVQKDNINLVAQANSEYFGLKNYKIDVTSKDAANDKRLELHAVNDSKNVVSGSITYISKQEGAETFVEGSGSVKWNEEQKPANFKYIRTVLSDSVETLVNLAFGEQSYIVESRMTEFEYKNSFVYCEKKNQCANIDLHSKMNVIKPGHIEHLMHFDFDLRKLGFVPEFGLQISSEFPDLALPKYSLDLHINKEDKKYHLNVYYKPESGWIPAGITMSIPSRVLALESQVRYSPNGPLLFPIHGEVSLYPDKNRPQQKTSARMSITATTNDSQKTAVADFGFSHPKLGEELTLKINAKLERPQENTLNVETSAVLSHNCFGGKRVSQLKLEVNPTHVKFTFDTPLVKVMDLEASAIVKDNLQQGDLKFSVLEGKQVQVHAIAKDFRYYEFTTGYSDESEQKLSIIGHLEPEKQVDIAVDIVLPGQKKNIVHGGLFLKDNFMSSKYGLSKDNFNYFVTGLKNDLTNLQSHIQEVGDKNSEEFTRMIDRIRPTFKGLEQSYREEVEKLANEIADDEILKEISEAMNFVTKFLAKFISDILDVTKPMVDKTAEAVSDVADKIKDLYVKQLEPQVKELYANVASVIGEYFDGIVDTAAHFAAVVIDFFERHKPEIEELTNTLTEIFIDLTKVLVAQLMEWRVKVNQIYEELNRQINEMPILATLKEKWEEIVPDQVLGILQETLNAISQVLPTEETKIFSDEFNNYISKKLQHQKLDEAASTRSLYEKFTVAVSSLVQFIRTNIISMGISMAPSINAMPWLTNFLGPVSAPSLEGSVASNLINQLLHREVQDPIALLKAYRPRSLNPFAEVPGKLRAVIVNGQHIFTFDGRHLTLPGNCRYILAHDYVDRNFTLMIEMQDGAPKAVILENKMGDVVELKMHGQVALNGVNQELPIFIKDTFPFHESSGNHGLASSSGVLAACTEKLEVCFIQIDGYYFGKLRGLLGDGNNEAYDDFRMPNGKISTSESEFGNAYRLTSSCPAVKTPQHSHHQLHHMPLPAACEKVFGGMSPLRPLTLLMDVAPFRQACIHAVPNGDSEEVTKQACALGRGFAVLGYTSLLPAVMPPHCVSCTDAGKERAIGDIYEMELPTKQADIVVIIETTIGNEKTYKELVLPLVSQLVDNLKSQQVDDLKVYLIAVSSKYINANLYDTDLKLKTPKPIFDERSRYEKLNRIKTGNEKIDTFTNATINFVEYIKRSLGLTNIMTGYKDLTRLPFRAGAVKHTIAVVSERCEKENILLSSIRAAVYGTWYKQNAHTLSIVTRTPQLDEGDKLKQAVGYNKHSVLMCGDNKEEDTEALRATIKPTDDECTNFIESTDGFVFSASNYEAMNTEMQKQFVQTAVEAITKEMVREKLLECTCTYFDTFRAHSICITKDREEAASRRK